MNFDHEPATGVRSKATGRLYPTVGTMVASEGAKLLGAILAAAGIEATDGEVARLWSARGDLFALLSQAYEAEHKAASRAVGDFLSPFFFIGKET